MTQNTAKPEKQIYNYAEDENISPLKKAFYDHALKSNDLSSLFVKWRLYRKKKKQDRKNKNITNNDQVETYEDNNRNIQSSGNTSDNEETQEITILYQEEIHLKIKKQNGN